MSFQAMSWAVSQTVESAGQKLVLIMLANYCNSHTGQCNPSHKSLANECSMGLSTLKRNIQSLEEMGLVTILHKSMDGVSLPNQYMLNLEGVGSNWTDGQSKSDLGVGPNRATNQEVKPRKEPSNTLSCPSDVPDTVWKDFLEIRKAKGSPLTTTALEGISREAEKAGMPLSEALSECCARGWQGFKASWILKDREDGQQSTSSHFAGMI